MAGQLYGRSIAASQSLQCRSQTHLIDGFSKSANHFHTLFLCCSLCSLLFPPDQPRVMGQVRRGLADASLPPNGRYFHSTNTLNFTNQRICRSTIIPASLQTARPTHNYIHKNKYLHFAGAQNVQFEQVNLQLCTNCTICMRAVYLQHTIFSAGIPSASGSLRWKDYQSFLLRTTAFMLKNISVALLRPRVFGVALSIEKTVSVKNDVYIRLPT